MEHIEEEKYKHSVEHEKKRSMQMMQHGKWTKSQGVSHQPFDIVYCRPKSDSDINPVMVFRWSEEVTCLTTNE